MNIHQKWIFPILGTTLKGLGKIFVVFTVDIWLWFSVAITYMLRELTFFHCVKFLFVSFDCISLPIVSMPKLKGGG